MDQRREALTATGKQIDLERTDSKFAQVTRRYLARNKVAYRRIFGHAKRGTGCLVISPKPRWRGCLAILVRVDIRVDRSEAVDTHLS